MLLIYYRTYTTHALLGFLFGVDDPAGRPQHQPVAAAAGRGSSASPSGRVKLDPEDIRELFFDATERV